MPIIDHLNGGELAALVERVRVLERGNPMLATSLTTGRFRIGGTAVLLVDSSGGLIVHGTINGDGTITWTGTLNLSGPFNLTGTATINGGGALDFPGAYAMTLSPTAASGNPGIAFPNGQIGGNSSGIFMVYPGTLNGFAAEASLASMGAGNNFVTADTSKTAVSGPFWLDTTGATTTTAANVVMNSTTGLLQRSTSARRFKIGPKLMKLAPTILDVRMKDWIDKTARQNHEPDVRVPGVIAEEVAAAGGDAFVTFDGAGDIEGVAYDRLAMARTQVLADRLDAALKRIDQLERKLDATK